MTVDSAIDLIQEKQNLLLGLISQINLHDKDDPDEMDKEILQHEMKIIELWKQDLDDILDELISD
ncbi:MAG: hypothetical protein HZB73_01725 [Nitrosarchaeum sp.]|nr:hypothetical protein [Nitrosarchaeum sp.]